MYCVWIDRYPGTAPTCRQTCGLYFHLETTCSLLTGLYQVPTSIKLAVTRYRFT